MSRRPPKLRLSDLRTNPEPVTVAECDVTPGLHEWIEGEIKRREEAARASLATWGEPVPPGPLLAELVRYAVDNLGLPEDQLTALAAENRRLRDDAFPERRVHADLHGPVAALRRCAADRKILAAHPYTTRVVNPVDGSHTAGFGCETCHDWDGVPEGRGNCATILALAEAYGLETASEADVEVVDD